MTKNNLNNWTLIKVINEEEYAEISKQKMTYQDKALVLQNT